MTVALKTTLLALLAVLTAGPGEFKCVAQEKKVEVKFSPLAKADEDRLNRQRQLIAATLKEKFGIESLKRDKSDLKSIQAILDGKVFGPSQTDELESLGVVFGDVLAKELGLHWVIITDEYGTDATLRYRETSWNFNALTMISRRVERNEKVDVEWLFKQTEKHVSEARTQLDK